MYCDIQDFGKVQHLNRLAYCEEQSQITNAAVCLNLAERNVLNWNKLNLDFVSIKEDIFFRIKLSLMALLCFLGYASNFFADQ